MSRGGEVMLQHQKVLADFGDFALQSEDLDEVLHEACRLVAEAMGTGRAKVLEIEQGGESLFVRAGVGWDPGVVGQMHITMSENSSESYAITAGRPIITQDIRTETRFGLPDFLRGAGVMAMANVPIVLPGKRAYGLLQVDATEPRAFDEADTEFLRIYATILGPVIDRLFKVGELRSSEEHYRVLFNAIDQGFMEVEVVMGADGRAVDWRYVALNPAFGRLTGMTDVTGRLASEVAPDLEPEWAERYTQVVCTGEAIRFEQEAAMVGRWFDIHLSRMSGAGSRRVAVVYDDVTERKRAEQALRESEERQAFLLRLSDALRAETSAEAMTNRALRMLFDQMRLDRCYVGIYRLAEDAGDFPHQVHDDRLPALPAQVRLSDFPEALRVAFDRTLVIDDVVTMEGLSVSDRASFSGLGLGALIAATLRKGGSNPLWAIVAVSTRPRAWTQGDVSLVEEVAERTWAAVEQARAEAARAKSEEALRVSEALFRQFADASSDVLWIRDANTLRFDYVSPAFEAIYGDRFERVFADNDVRRWAKLILPEDRGSALDAFRRVRRGEQVTHEFRIRRPSDNEERWVRDTSFPLMGEAGQVERVAGIGQDVTDLKRAEATVAASEVRLRVLTEGIPQFVWRAVDHGHWTWASPQWTAFTGQAEEASHGWGWLEAVHPDDREGARAAWEQSKATGTFEAEYRLMEAATGEHRWFQSRATQVRDEAGRLVEWLGTSTDVQNLRQMQERQQVLVAELQHRTRNLLGVVRSTMSTTLRGTRSLDEFVPAYRDRLNALARVNGLLSRLGEDDRVTFDELIQVELGALGAVDAQGRGEHVTLDGPRGVRLRSTTVQTFALALHELATNAIKYGALKQPDGRLSVRWRRTQGKAGTMDGAKLRVEWTETGVAMPEPGAAPQGSGYGRELIERALPYQLRAETTYELGPDGVRCTITLPLSLSAEPADA